MSLTSAEEISFQECYILEQRAWFTDFRINPDTVPEGMYLYQLQYSDEDESYPCVVERSVGVNYYGCIIMKEPLEQLEDIQDEDGHVMLVYDDFYFTGEICTLDEIV